MSVRWFGADGELPQPLREALDAPQVPLLDSLSWVSDFSATVHDAAARAAWLRVAPGPEIDAGGTSGTDPGGFVLALRHARRPIGQRAWPAAEVLESLSNYYTMRWSPLAARPEDLLDGVAWREAAQAMVDRGPAWIGLEPVASEARWLGAAADALSDAGCALRSGEAWGNWVAHVGGASFDEWFSRRPAALRNTWRRRLRQLERRARVRFVLCTGEAGDPIGLDDALAGYQEVYRRSWKPPEAHAAFVPALVRRAAARGALRLGLLLADDVPIAAQLWLRDGDATLIYKLAYDEAWKPYSPGLALSVHMFRSAIDIERVRLIDYGSGDDAYKRDWMDERRVRVALRAYRLRHPVGASLALRAYLRGELR